jgi:hypothetical protein
MGSYQEIVNLAHSPEVQSFADDWIAEATAVEGSQDKQITLFASDGVCSGSIGTGARSDNSSGVEPQIVATEPAVTAID